ncbi:MAG: carbohydrate ABC transporter permease [Lachnospiraceae bacterium]
MRISKKKKLVLWCFTLVVGFIIMWPVYWIVKSSFTQQTDLFKSPIEYFSLNWTFDNYRRLIDAAGMLDYLKGTIIITAAALVLSVLLCALAGYGFARCQTRGINLAFAFITFSTMIPGTVTVIPLMTMWRKLGLSDTYSGLIILYFSILIPFSTILYTGFISQIPPSLEEAARIDGATMVGAFVKIIMPLLKPIMATLSIINFITCLNEFFTPLMFTTTNVKVMSLLMSSIPKVNQYQMPWGAISAAGCLMLLPAILFIVCFEKNIMGGLMMGSIKQ